VEGLAPGQQSAIAARLPLEQRLDVYHDVYVRSGHPKTMLTPAFDGSGEAGFDAVMSRIRDRQSFNEFFWIVHWLGLNGEIDVCEPRFFEPLKQKADRYNVVDRDHPVPVSFGRCELIL
jgi:hypothetical protein